VTFVLDTNAVSALMKGTAAFVDRLASYAPTDVAIPQPVIAELAYGIERLPRSRRREALQARFDLICSEIPRAEWTDAVSHAYGRIKAVLERRGLRVEDFDVAIAAHAVASGATLVTANAAHMARVPGLQLEDWTR
jgi:tRNA(fMet)-specific endonuclease VapC